MAFKTFSDGNALAASEVNDYLMKQAVIACTAATRPSAPQAGMTIYETDTGTQLVYTGSAWKPLAGGLPDTAVAGSSSSQVDIPQVVQWQQFPGAQFTALNMVLPYDAYCQVKLGAWYAVNSAGSASNYVAQDFELTGATLRSPGSTQVTNADQWCRIPYLRYGDAATGLITDDVFKFNAGTTGVYARCFVNHSSVDAEVSYASLRVTPIRWA